MIHFDTDECVIKAQGSFGIIVLEVGFFLHELNREFNEDPRYEQDEFISAGEHMTSFDYAYKLGAVRDWLFSQSK